MVSIPFLSSIVSAVMMASQGEQQTDVFPDQKTADQMLNNRPIIGVLAQPNDGSAPNCDLYIAYSYIQLIESMGARPVALKCTDSRETLKAQMDSINGLILPGGDTPIYTEAPGDYQSVYDEAYTEYMDVTQYLMNIAKEKNEKGIHFPVLGICLGFESMMLEALGTKGLGSCDALGYPSAEKLTNTNDSFWFKDLSASAVKTAKKEDVIYESHRDCYTLDMWNDDQALREAYLMTSTAFDRQGKEYVNSVEGKRYPFFAVQYHPERPIFEYASTYNIPHNLNAIYWSQLLRDKFGKQIRMNYQNYPSLEEELDALIYNYDPVYQGDKGFMQIYCLAT